MNYPAASAIKEIWQKDPRTLAATWLDNRQAQWDVVALRRQCPCAECVDETSGARKLVPEQIAESVRPLVIRSVGRYAMAIEFSDGHRTGIYTYDLLRKLSQQ